MQFRFISLFLITIIGFSSSAQQSDVWTDFLNAKKNGTEAILPDFSYAGYKYSELPIPTVNYKVYDVTKFGAIPNDQKSDKIAIEKAIAAATKNGEGIIYFPKGKFVINNAEDKLTPIIVMASNIVFRGEGQGEDGTVLFFDRHFEPTHPNKLWTTPYMVQCTTEGKNMELATVVQDAQRETFSLELSDTSKIKKGDWLILEVNNNSKDLIEYDLQPIKPEPEWTSILEKGVQVNERHQVASVKGNTVTFVDPIHYDVQAKHQWRVSTFAHSEGIGFENMIFEGNWKQDFVHHESALHDGGWSILKIHKNVNSWVKDCTFKNVNNPLSFSSSAACTAMNIKIEGKVGHSAVHASGSTGVLLANINDHAGMHHAVGVGGGSNTATVIWRSKYPAHSSFESHASQPRCTLFDNVEGGFFQGRAGGARKNLPNHGRYLVLWNFKEIDEAEENFTFWSTTTWYWKFVPPIIVGFHGSGTTFKEDEIQILESLGKAVKPVSLFEEQLKLRLGKLPDWLQTIKLNNL